MTNPLPPEGFNKLVAHYDQQLVPILKACCTAPDPLDHVAALLMAELIQSVVLARTLDFSPGDFMVTVAKAMKVGIQEFDSIVAQHEALNAIAKASRSSNETT